MGGGGGWWWWVGVEGEGRDSLALVNIHTLLQNNTMHPSSKLVNSYGATCSIIDNCFWLFPCNFAFLSFKDSTKTQILL